MAAVAAMIIWYGGGGAMIDRQKLSKTLATYILFYAIGVRKRVFSMDRLALKLLMRAEHGHVF